MGCQKEFLFTCLPGDDHTATVVEEDRAGHEIFKVEELNFNFKRKYLLDPVTRGVCGSPAKR